MRIAHLAFYSSYVLVVVQNKIIVLLCNKMHTTSVVVVTNFTKNSTSGAKRAGGRLLPLLRGKTRHLFFLEKVTYFFMCYIS